MVELKSVCVRRGGAAVLEDVWLAVAPGTVHVVSGPNGAGKTTLLRTILGQVPFEGTVRLHWRGAGRIGYVPQSLGFDAGIPLTVAEFLALGWQRRPVCLGRSTSSRRRAAEALEAVGLEGLADRRVGVLSGGELRRMLLARALDPAPELLLLDEPTAGVDPEGIRAMEAAVERLRKGRGTTALLVSHDADQARRIGDRVSRLDRTGLADA